VAQPHHPRATRRSTQTVPLLSSQRPNSGLASSRNRHLGSSASARSALPTCSTVARCCVSRSSTNVFRFYPSIANIGGTNTPQVSAMSEVALLDLNALAPLGRCA
jgi:hypothetical protein